MTGPLAATELGFSLHAATTAEADDELGRATLLRYLLRPPIAHNRLKLLPSGLVRIELRRPFADSAVATKQLRLAARLVGLDQRPQAHPPLSLAPLDGAPRQNVPARARLKRK